MKSNYFPRYLTNFFNFRSYKRNRLVLFILVINIPFLYSQQTYTFTNASATGSAGPTQTQINSAYASTNLNGSVTVNGGIQTWTVPAAGAYRIEAIGGQGYGTFGGRGAYMAGDFTLTAGTVLKILVGQQGGAPISSFNQYGGGGGSFVTGTTNVPYVVAGGGGGSWAAAYTSVTDAATVTTGNTGANGPTNGTGGTGGGGGSTASYADGGAGITGNGGGAAGGLSFINGGNGGANRGQGGFGGGGGTSSWDSRRGGGGGGYSGGGGAGSTTSGLPQGGGGGSYNSGTNQVNITGFNSGHGKVIITELCNITLSATTTSVINTICSGSSATLITNAVSDYSWSTGATTSSIVVSPTVTTTYTLGATGSSNCTAFAIITISVNTSVPNLVIGNSATSGSVCAGSTVALSASGAINYTWSSGFGNDVSFIPAASSVYTVTGANACGTSTASTPVFVNPNPTVSVNSGTICSGNSFTISPAGALSYTYSTGTNVISPYVPSPSIGNTIYTITGSNSHGCNATANGTLVVYPTPTVSVGSGTICVGKNYTISPVGATFYTVTGGATVVSPSVTTSFSVIGSNTAGCVSNNTAVSNVSVFALPTVAINSGTVCAGKAFTLVASGANNYTYSSGSSIVYPVNTTTYSVIGRFSNGCVSSNTAIANITVYSTPSISVNSGSICAGQSFTMNPAGATTYTYAGGNNIVTPIGTIHYTVIGSTSAGCLSSNTATSFITVVPNPVLSVNNGAICLGSTFVLFPAGASTYTFSSPSPSVSPVTTSQYTISGSNTSGCQSSIVATVSVLPLPTVSISGPNGVCAGKTGTLSGQGALSYTWNTNYVGNTMLILPITTTTYSITGEDANGCKNTAIKTINHYPIPAISISGNTNICQGFPATLLANGTGLSYLWNTGFQGNPLVSTPGLTSTYSVIGTDLNGCTNNASVTVNVIPSPTVTAIASNTTICDGGSVILNGGGALTYTWSGGVNNNSVFYPSVTATYTVNGTSGNGCINGATVLVVVNPLPVVSVSTTSQPICPGQTATLTGSGANIYSWNTGGITSKIVISPTITTSYTVTGTDVNGCKADVVFSQVVDECLGLSRYSNSDLVSVYPNPLQFQVNIRLSGIDLPLNLEIYNSIGQLLHTQTLTGLINTIETDDFKNGVYFFKIYKNNELIYVKKLVKEN